MDKLERDHHWNRFYQEERNLLRWIANNSRCLLDLDQKSIEITEFDEPLLFIRKVYLLPSDLLSEAEFRYQKTKNTFLEVTEFTGDNTLRLPTRLPQIYTNVERLLHSSYPAHQSIKVKRIGECDLYRSEPYANASDESIGLIESEKACAKLIASGLTTAYVRFIPSQNCHAVTVESEQLYLWANCNSIQRRIPTGFRFEARITSFDKDKPERTHLGLILLCQDTAPFIEESLPRKKRSDAQSKQMIELPIESKYSFYVND
jgi:hypothetical protein